jgi:peroxiredoxin
VKKNAQFILLLLATFLIADSGFTQAQKTTRISGSITVDQRLDSTGDYSGISVHIVDIGGQRGVDTLFAAITNIDGSFSGTARFTNKGEFTASISRYGIPLAATAVILAPNDPVTITGQLPNFEETVSVESKEQSAMNTYQRVERNYNRIVDFINSGAVEVTQDTIPVIINTWSDLFWSVRELHPGTLAADIGTLRSVEILAGFNDEVVLRRVRESMSDNSFYTAAKVRLGAGAKLRLEGVQPAIAFIDSVLKMRIPEDDRIVLEMESIEIKIDNGMEQEAKTRLLAFREKHKNTPSLAEWVDVIMYDIENLFPGLPAPSFSLQLHRGGRVQNQDLIGKTVLIEIANFASQTYQTENTFLGLLYERFNDKNFEIVTIPIHDSRITVNAFVQDRNIPWPVVSAGQFNSADIIQKFNLTVIPTRILIAPDGTIIRKYSGTNFAIIQNDIIRILEEETL